MNKLSKILIKYEFTFEGIYIKKNYSFDLILKFFVSLSIFRESNFVLTTVLGISSRKRYIKSLAKNSPL